MTDDEAIEEVVRRTGVERFRWLCSEANALPAPNSRTDYLRRVRELAAGGPVVAYPTAAQMAANLGRAFFSWAVSGFSIASDEEVSRRLAICGGCEHWDGARCKLCGCYTEYKVRMKTEHCPVQKW